VEEKQTWDHPGEKPRSSKGESGWGTRYIKEKKGPKEVGDAAAWRAMGQKTTKKKDEKKKDETESRKEKKNYNLSENEMTSKIDGANQRENSSRRIGGEIGWRFTTKAVKSLWGEAQRDATFGCVRADGKRQKVSFL